MTTIRTASFLPRTPLPFALALACLPACVHCLLACRSVCLLACWTPRSAGLNVSPAASFGLCVRDLLASPALGPAVLAPPVVCSSACLPAPPFPQPATTDHGQPRHVNVNRHALLLNDDGASILCSFHGLGRAQVKLTRLTLSR